LMLGYSQIPPLPIHKPHDPPWSVCASILL
jgi:hypothetical protein